MNIYKTSLLSCYLSRHYLVVLGFHPVWMYWNSVLTLTTQSWHRSKIAISFTCRSHIPLSLYVSCCCSVAKSCLTLYGPMVCSTPGFPVLYYFLEFTQTHVQWVSDAIQPSHPVAPFSSCPQSFPASGSSFPMSRLFPSGGQSIGASDPASVLPMNQLSPVTQSGPTHCDPMDCRAPGFPVHHQLPELAQTHVYRVCDAIQTSHPLKIQWIFRANFF